MPHSSLTMSIHGTPTCDGARARRRLLVVEFRQAGHPPRAPSSNVIVGKRTSVAKAKADVDASLLGVTRGIFGHTVVTSSRHWILTDPRE